MTSDRPLVTPAVMATLRRMELDQVAAATFRSFGGRVPAILLKGASIAQWLYDDAVRPYTDVDVLVSPDTREEAESILAGEGFRGRYRGFAAVERNHYGEAWTRPDGSTVDLHYSLFGTTVSATRVWEVLAPRTETIRVASADVPALARPARAMHIALHAAQHGPDEAQTLGDLERALRRLDPDGWREAAELASELGAMTTFAAGLRLVPTGRDLADALGVADDGSRWVRIMAGPARWARGTAALEALATTSGRHRASLIWRLVFPSAAKMRFRSRLARRGGAGLALAYVLRWILLFPRVVVSGWRWIHAHHAA